MVEHQCSLVILGQRFLSYLTDSQNTVLGAAATSTCVLPHWPVKFLFRPLELGNHRFEVFGMFLMMLV